MDEGSAEPTGPVPASPADMSGKRGTRGSAGSVEALLGRAMQAHQAGDLVTAQALYTETLQASPSNFGALYALGVCLCQQGQHDRGLPFLEQALALKPDYAEAHSNIADAFNALSRHEEALPHAEQAVALDPASAEACLNLGNALHGLARHDEAMARYQQALALNPAFAKAFNNQGLALHALGRDDQAIARYRQALVLKPDYAEAEYNLSLSLLALGRLAEGWLPYEMRWQVKGLTARRPDFQRPLWLGMEDIAGKTILLYAEQGLGDTIQFCRYAALVARQGARVILEVQPALRALLANLQGPHQVLASGDPLPDFDLHCPLLSLPLALDTRLETIPAPVPYLTAQPERIAKWEALLGPRQKPRIGIAWSGNPQNKNDRNRSIPLHRLLPLLTAGASLVSLHHEARPEEQAVLAAHPEILHFGGTLSEFTNMAALVTQLDLVISVCTSVVHLAGALGRPVWVLLPFAPDWRWMLDRNDSPWYPTARLFRQPRIGDWDCVIHTVAEHLAAFGREALPCPQIR